MSFSQEINLSAGNFFEGEPFIAANPANPNHLVVAWMGFVPANGLRLSIKTRTTFDGGQSWSNTYIIPHVVSNYKSADPSLVFDGYGNLFLSFIDYRESPDSGSVYLFKSTDGGVSWNAGVSVIDAYADAGELPIDRPWFAVNNEGNKLFFTTKPAPWIPAPNRPYAVFSVDSGQTWQSWRYLDTTGFLTGNLIAQPMASPTVSGQTFYAAYPSYVLSQNFLPQFILAATADNGAHFTYHTIFAGANTATNDSAKLGYRLLADPSDTLHLVFVFPYRPAGTDIDILLTETFNAGVSWSTPLRLNDDPLGNGKMQDMVWVDFDADGSIVVSWRDRRNGSVSGYASASQFYYAYRNSDSLNFQTNMLLSDTLLPFNTILTSNGNDFMGIELVLDTLHAVYGCTRDGSLDIWYVKKAASTGITTSVAQLNQDVEQVLAVPLDKSGLYHIQQANGYPVEIVQVLHTTGQALSNGLKPSCPSCVDLRNESPGVYLVTGRTNNRIFTIKIMR